MNPFYFGPSERPLFGAYTRGRDAGEGAHGVLLCYPAGSEYMRAHRAFRQLNNLLNRAGLHVLRFDYSCTGDSAGDGVEATLDGWIEDIDWALDELQDTSLCDRVSVLGLRWGATLAALACRERDDVEHLVMWDPIVSGSDYLNFVMGTDRPARTVGVEGFPFTPEMCAAMAEVDLASDFPASGDTDISVLVAEDRPDYRSMWSAVEAEGVGREYRHVPSLADWSRADPFGDALIPQEIIQVAVEMLKTPEVKE
jgi:pimeloyl-ACP methyl ester carboxylesterase